MIDGLSREGSEGGSEAWSLLELSGEEWLLRRKWFRNKENHIRLNETLLTIGNGYLNIRGSLEELPPGHSGGMYLSGIYDKSEAAVEELVKCPMWTGLSVWIGEYKLCVSTCTVLHHEQILDMKKGALHRITTFREKSGKILTLETVRLVFMHNVHLGMMVVKVTPQNFSGSICLLSGLDGEVYNKGFFPREKLKHLHLERIERGRDFMYLEMTTREQNLRISEAASWRLISPLSRLQKWEPRIYGENFASEITLDVREGESSLFEKLAVVVTSRELLAEDMFKGSICMLKSFVLSGVTTEISAHLEAWDKKWKQADIVIIGDEKAQHALRYNIYQLLINGPSVAASIGAKFLSSEGYLGHVFWDTEIFILPFFIYNFPDIARNMLLYRYNTLAGAKKNALKMGYKGAKYAWESARTGEDVTPRFASKLERTIRLIYTGTEEDHIVSDVIYGVEKYFRVTGDKDFLVDYGLEMVFLTARFWASRVVEEGEHYSIRCVIGPDEFHEHVNNNAYTNYLVKWHLNLAVLLFRYMGRKHSDILRDLAVKITLEKEEVDSWMVISRKIKLSYNPETRLFEQFDGYFSLKDYCIEGFDRQGNPVLPEGIDYGNIQSTRLIKQADVLIMMTLFPHLFSDEDKAANFEFYEKRTAHASSLSCCIHAMMGLAVGKRARAYHYFIKAAHFDLKNLHQNTALGIHAAAVGGTWQAVVYGFGGFSIKSDRLVLKPWLPKKWKSLAFCVHWRARTVEITLFHDSVSILIRSDEEISLPMSLYKKSYKITTNKRYELPYCTLEHSQRILDEKKIKDCTDRSPY